MMQSYIFITNKQEKVFDILKDAKIKCVDMTGRYQNKISLHVHMVENNEEIMQLPVGLSLTAVIKILLYKSQNDSFLICIAHLIFLGLSNPQELTSTVIYSLLE